MTLISQWKWCKTKDPKRVTYRVRQVVSSAKEESVMNIQQISYTHPSANTAVDVSLQALVPPSHTDGLITGQAPRVGVTSIVILLQL